MNFFVRGFLLFAVSDVVSSRELHYGRNAYGFTEGEQQANNEWFFKFAGVFPRIFVLCVGKGCVRHSPGPTCFWPEEVLSKVRTFNGDDLHARHYQLDLLHLNRDTAGRPYHKLVNVLFFGHMTRVAKMENLASFLYLEDDIEAMRPPSFDLNDLERALKMYPWQTLRLGASFQFGVTKTTGGTTACASHCACKGWGGLGRDLCETSWKKQNYSSLPISDAALQKTSCDLRSTIGLGVHESAYEDIESMYSLALATMDSRVDHFCGVGATASLCAKLREGGEPDWQPFYSALPWLDVWIPAAFHNVYFTPAIASQKKLTTVGEDFRELCGVP